MAQLHSDLPWVDAVGDVVGATEREALAGLALVVHRYGARPAGRDAVAGRVPGPPVGIGQVTSGPALPRLPVAGSAVLAA